MTAGCGISISVGQPGMSVSVPESIIQVQAPTTTILIEADPCGAGGSVFCRKSVIAVTSAIVAVSVLVAAVQAVVQSAPIQVSANIGYAGPRGPAGEAAVIQSVMYSTDLVVGQVVYLDNGLAYPVTNAMQEAVLYLLALVQETAGTSAVRDVLLTGFFSDASLSLFAGRVYLGADGFPHGVDVAGANYVPLGHSGGGSSFFFNPRERYIR